MLIFLPIKISYDKINAYDIIQVKGNYKNSQRVITKYIFYVIFPKMDNPRNHEILSPMTNNLDEGKGLLVYYTVTMTITQIQIILRTYTINQR